MCRLLIRHDMPGGETAVRAGALEFEDLGDDLAPGVCQGELG